MRKTLQTWFAQATIVILTLLCGHAGVAIAQIAISTTQPTADRTINDRLDRELPEAAFDRKGFSDVIDFMRDAGDANIFVDWKHLEAAGVDRKTPVTLKLKNKKFGAALKSVIDVAGKGKLCSVELHGVLVISTAEANERLAAAIKAEQKQLDEKTKKQLNPALINVKFDGVALSDTVGFFGDVCNLKAEVDWEELNEAGIEENAPVFGKFKGVTVGDALIIIFQTMTDRPIVFTGVDGKLHISAGPAAAPTTTPAASPKEPEITPAKTD